MCPVHVRCTAHADNCLVRKSLKHPEHRERHRKPPPPRHGKTLLFLPQKGLAVRKVFSGGSVWHCLDSSAVPRFQRQPCPDLPPHGIA